MSFQPVVPMSGYAGWRFLERTQDSQRQSHAAAPAALRDEQYLRERIAGITTAEDLVGDRRLLRIALTAFGLAEDLPNRAYIRKVLESPTAEPRSFVNRLADKRYADLSRAFGFGDPGGVRTGDPGFADRMIDAFRARQFEAAVGEVDGSMRLALGLQRDLVALAESAVTPDTAWYTVLGNQALRSVFETAYRLPNGFGALDLDQQVGILRARTQRLFGDPEIAQFADPDKLALLTRQFFVGEQIAQITTMSSNAAALMLLQAGQDSLRQVLPGRGTWR